jgi:hypothetical protein
LLPALAALKPPLLSGLVTPRLRGRLMPGLQGSHRWRINALLKGADMIRKTLGVVVLAGLAVLAASQWADTKRFLKIKQLSLQQGHPGNVPAQGRKVYPQRPGTGEADGTGDFDSASRGGPARAGTTRQM